jgi:protein SCO1/2
LVEAAEGEYRLEKIWPADPAASSAVDAAAKTLTQETVALGRSAYREVGERAPEFTLFDQEGRVVESKRFRGKQVMINFIFTRCPVAKMCPAAVARFQQTQKLAREQGIADLELISISLDPEYDTPGILKEYAIQRAIDTSNYTFLTGPQMAIKSLLQQFGILAELQGDLLNHTAATLLLDGSGRILHRADGSEWDVQEFVGKMKRG